jgi:aminopeptidase YwaD
MHVLLLYAAFTWTSELPKCSLVHQGTSRSDSSVSFVGTALPDTALTGPGLIKPTLGDGNETPDTSRAVYGQRVLVRQVGGPDSARLERAFRRLGRREVIVVPWSLNSLCGPEVWRGTFRFVPPNTPTFFTFRLRPEPWWRRGVPVLDQDVISGAMHVPGQSQSVTALDYLAFHRTLPTRKGIEARGEHAWDPFFQWLERNPRLAEKSPLSSIREEIEWRRLDIAATRRGTPPEVLAHFVLARNRYSGARARELVAFMDPTFRLPGNAAFDRALDRIETLLRSAGYVREDSASSKRLVYRIEKRPMRGPAWDVIDASLTIVGDRAPLLRLATNLNMLAANSMSTPDSGVVAEIVDVGKGTASDYERANVAGKIVLGEGGVGQLFAEAVQKRGAVGVLAYRMPAYTRPEINRGSIQFSGIPLDTARKSWGMPISRGALDSLRAALTRGPVKVRVVAKTRLFPSQERAIVAEVRGSTHPAERFVYSAHVQEPGANDNASGVGALIEIARALAEVSRTGGAIPKRTITMLFGNEIAQTRNFLADDTVRTRGVKWGLSLDMVGEDTRKTGGTFLIEKMPDPSAVWTRGEEKHSEWGGKPLTKEQIVPHYFNDVLHARCLDQAAATGWVVKTNPFEGGSDHTPFLDAKKPGVLFWHFTDQFYHTDGDRLDKVSAETLRNVGTCALVSALTLTSADGETARGIVAQLEKTAITRLDTELALSRAAMSAGGNAAHERDILQTWTDYYLGALAAASDIEVGGSSAATMQAIESARERVRADGARRVQTIR